MLPWSDLGYRQLTPHGEYLALGRNDNERSAAYRELFRSELDPAQLDEIRSAVNGGFVLGNDRFKAQIAEMLKRRVERGAPGRPRKEKPALSEAELQPGCFHLPENGVCPLLLRHVYSGPKGRSYRPGIYECQVDPVPSITAWVLKGGQVVNPDFNGRPGWQNSTAAASGTGRPR